MSTEEKRRRLRRLVPSWSFLTRLRRPLLFRLAGKEGGRKGALGYVWCFLRLSLGKPQCFGLAFHSVVTLRASWYAPPDTGVSDLWAVALEYLLSIEGADQTYWSAPFCGEVIFICFALCRGGALLRPRVLISSEQRAEQSPAPTGCIPKALLAGELSAKQTERLSQIRLNLSVLASPSQLPWEGRLWTAPSPHRGRLFSFLPKNLYNFNAQFSPFCGQFSCRFCWKAVTMKL